MDGIICMCRVQNDKVKEKLLYEYCEYESSTNLRCQAVCSSFFPTKLYFHMQYEAFCHRIHIFNVFYHTFGYFFFFFHFTWLYFGCVIAFGVRRVRAWLLCDNFPFLLVTKWKKKKNNKIIFIEVWSWKLNLVERWHNRIKSKRTWHSSNIRFELLDRVGLNRGVDFLLFFFFVLRFSKTSFCVGIHNEMDKYFVSLCILFWLNFFCETFFWSDEIF